MTMMFFVKFLILTAIGLSIILLIMKQAYQIGHDVLAYENGTPLVCFKLFIMETVFLTILFWIIYSSQSTFGQSHYIFLDISVTYFSSKLLLGAMKMKGKRIRKGYYEFIVPLRKSVLDFLKATRRPLLAKLQAIESRRLW